MTRDPRRILRDLESHAEIFLSLAPTSAALREVANHLAETAARLRAQADEAEAYEAKGGEA